MKLSFNEFCEYVEKNILNYIDGNNQTRVKIEKVVKPNDLVLHGLSVRTSDDEVAPLIYLDPIYEHIDDTTELDTVLRSIASYTKCKAPMGVSRHISLEYEDIKDKLELAVVDEMLNEKRIEKLATLSLGNGMYATFHIIILSDDTDRFSIAITKEMAATYGYDYSRMFADASDNMRRKYPATFTEMDAVVHEIMTGERIARPLLRDIHKLCRKSGAYSFTNTAFCFGAYNFWIGNTQKKSQYYLTAAIM